MTVCNQTIETVQLSERVRPTVPASLRSRPAQPAAGAAALVCRPLRHRCRQCAGRDAVDWRRCHVWGARAASDVICPGRERATTRQHIAPCRAARRRREQSGQQEREEEKQEKEWGREKEQEQTAKGERVTQAGAAGGDGEERIGEVIG